MEIITRRKPNLIFKNFDECFDYVGTNVIKNLKVDIDHKLENFYNSNRTINGIKSFRIMVKSLYFNDTLLNNEYWLSRGWSIEESKENIIKEQKNRSKKAKDKLKDLKVIDYKKWCESYNTKKEYYMKRGMTELESIEFLKKRQNTFTLEYCINKYGDNGIDMWENRQKLWYDKIKDIKCDKNSSSSEYFKNKDGDDWIFEAINRLSFLNKEIIIDSIKNSGNNVVNFIKEVNNRDEILSMRDAYFIYNSKILQDFFNKTKDELNKIVRETLNIKINSFGVIRYFNGHICKSNGEYYIAKKLKELYIDYEYEKKYPNSNYICDFYIPIYDIYIEYLGMLKSDYIKKTFSEIYLSYKERFEKKENFLKENNIKYIAENNMVEIINKLKKYGN